MAGLVGTRPAEDDDVMLLVVPAGMGRATALRGLVEARHGVRPGAFTVARSDGAVLLPTLQALRNHHWREAEAARAPSVQRQSLWARIARLRRVLRADLGDPEAQLGLDLAVRASRVVDGAL